MKHITPDWPVPGNILALSTTRRGGVSNAPYDSLNVGDHVGDDPMAVAANRRRLLKDLPPGSRLNWLSQVHGTDVVEAGAAVAAIPEADASWSRTPGQACLVMTADCLPVLFCSAQGDVVAAAHAGWRGLLGGVLERTVEAMACEPGALLAWLGPAIGSEAFEVGAEVRDAFLDAAVHGQHDVIDACFSPIEVSSGQFLCNLYALARARLATLGVTRTYGGDFCTYRATSEFFSYRRDGQTGRMVTLILLE